MSEHEHEFQFAKFEHIKDEYPKMYLFCKCGAVERTRFGLYDHANTIEITIKEPSKKKDII